MMHPFRTLLGIALLASAAVCTRAQQPAAVIPGAVPGGAVMPTVNRIRPEVPIRVGGVFTAGLGPVDANGISRLSRENRDWIAANCDVVALSPTAIDAGTFPAMNKINHLFTPLLYLYTSSLYEKPHRGSIGLWQPSMESWTLRRRDGSEVPFPEPGGHWMDFANVPWAEYWADRLNDLTREYGAYGVAAAELPLGNTFVGSDLKSYRSVADRAAATREWLGAVRKRYRNLIIPSAIGFDLAAGHDTPDPVTSFVAPALQPRLWNDFFGLTDGAWCEGWIRPYWDKTPVAESLWETQMEAADRAGRLGQVFIASAAYSNDAELEFALASFLMIEHNQGRAVFQPMPVRPSDLPDAGFSLQTLRREVAAKPRYFRPPLGRGMQERHQLPAEGGPVWRRYFQFGDVYVNSDENKTVSVSFAGYMRRVDGQLVRRVTLPPHSGAILLYTSVTKPNRRTGTKRAVSHRPVRSSG